MIAAILPSYKSKESIRLVIEAMPDCVSHIIVVDDACPLNTGSYVEELFPQDNIIVIYHEKNMGVGGATITGYKAALELPVEIMVKIDSDGQMDPAEIIRLAKPIQAGLCDYTKGNRFYSLDNLTSMPFIRLFGNSVLSFFSKASSGYWDVMDPTNGFTAIHRSVLSILDLQKLSKRFFFESDMLFRLRISGAKVFDIPMEAIYGDETSNLSIRKSIPEFLLKHGNRFLKRIFYTYFLRDFNAGSFLLISSAIFLLIGMGYGVSEWHQHSSINQATPTGTIVITAVVILTGLNFLISFINYDITQRITDALHPRL